MRGKNVAVIGTGATGVQITQEVSGERHNRPSETELSLPGAAVGPGDWRRRQPEDVPTNAQPGMSHESGVHDQGRTEGAVSRSRRTIRRAKQMVQRFSVPMAGQPDV